MIEGADKFTIEEMREFKEVLDKPVPPGGHFDRICEGALTFARILLRKAVAKAEANKPNDNRSI